MASSADQTCCTPTSTSLLPAQFLVHVRGETPRTIQGAHPAGEDGSQAHSADEDGSQGGKEKEGPCQPKKGRALRKGSLAGFCSPRPHTISPLSADHWKRNKNLRKP
eukprot:1157266-Pelagomonas_calceolata.AAC.6